MMHLDLVATNVDHYVGLVIRLLSDTTFRNSQSETILQKFYNEMHKNDLIALEWAHFFRITKKFIAK